MIHFSPGPAKTAEYQELVALLITSGYGEVVEALMSAEVYKLNGRLNLAALARLLNWPSNKVSKTLQAMRELLMEGTE